MPENQEIVHLRSEVERLSAELDALRRSGLDTSKAEAMLAFEYDRIPNILKSPKAIRAQRLISTAVLFGLPVLLVVGAIIGGIDAYRDHQRSVDFWKSEEQFWNAFERDVDKSSAH
jgi:hypothetical protein